MTRPTNHKYSDCKRCDTCNHAQWTEINPLKVKGCKKHEWPTRDNRVCDDWEEER